MEVLNKDSLVRQKEYPTESSSKSRESVYIETSAQRSRGILEQWSVDNGKQIVTGSYEDRDGSFGQAAKTRRGVCHDQIATGTSVTMALRTRPISL
ncbi:hypothetical protein Taro_049152 [Colocasia esculenta]|uniref:Uncharacterized protein n=1 Tax=Colocasia esculenta TaxID=4460 RepID=A0A843XA90_COLES|nr:hypothetical protein [Colocasia esculenta]